MVSLSNSRAKVRVSDITYDLKFEVGQLDVLLIHGSTLVDVFSAAYTWGEEYLYFVDTDRRVSYRVRFANPASADVPSEEPERQQ